MLGRSGMNRIIAVLVMLLMGSSWQIISHQHEIRKLNIELEKEKGRYSDLKLEYNRLELQNSKDTATDHVEAIAREKEEVEAAKKAASKPAIPIPTNKAVEPIKAETKKDEVKSSPTRTETIKKEVKVEDKSTKKVEVKIVPKIEVKKVEAKPISKAETVKPAVKAAPTEDLLGDFLKKQALKGN